MEERKIKLETMFEMEYAENSNSAKVAYPKFILDLWFDDRDFMLIKYINYGYNFVAFFCSLDKSNKIKLLNYINDN
nr:MAG TPA: hypothetical protein [Bacteriophage sp.]